MLGELGEEGDEALRRVDLELSKAPGSASRQGTSLCTLQVVPEGRGVGGRGGASCPMSAPRLLADVAEASGLVAVFDEAVQVAGAPVGGIRWVRRRSMWR